MTYPFVTVEPEAQLTFPNWVDGGAQTYVAALFRSLRATLGRGTPATPRGEAARYNVPNPESIVPNYNETKQLTTAIRKQYNDATVTSGHPPRQTEGRM